MGFGPRPMRAVSDQLALERLGSVSLGRIAFTTSALPTIRPVNHAVIDGDVIVRTEKGSAVSAVVGQVVAYEADSIDDRHLGWSVVVTGIADVVSDPATRARYRELLVPWVNGDMELVVRIHPELITGFELVADQPDADQATAECHGAGR